jgi:hypothetical protein
VKKDRGIVSAIGCGLASAIASFMDNHYQIDVNRFDMNKEADLISFDSSCEANLRKLSPEKVMEVLCKHGTIITREQAESVIEFLYNLSEIAVAQYLRQEDCENNNLP